jgi:uncharacterized protein
MRATSVSGMRPPAVLNASDCWQLLPTQEVARVAWNGPDGVSIVPDNFTVRDRALWFRTQPYSELARQCKGGWVVVEVDHLEPVERSAWSVVEVGPTQLVASSEAPDQVLQMQVWVPGGARSLVVRVDPVRLTGRQIWGRPRAG